MSVTKHSHGSIARKAEGYHRVAVAQIDYNPVFFEDGRSFLEEPWPQLNRLPFTKLELGIDDPWYLRLSRLRSEVSRLYTIVLCRRLDAIVDFCGSLNTEFLLFPEFSIPTTLLPYLQAKARAFDITIVAGTHLVTGEAVNSGVYKQLDVVEPEIGSSVAPVIGSQANTLVPKLTLSQWELENKKELTGWNTILCPSGLRFAVLICLDQLDNEHFYLSGLVTQEEMGQIDFMMIPARTPSGTMAQFSSLLNNALKGYKRPSFFANQASEGGSFMAVLEMPHLNHPERLRLSAAEEGVLICDVDFRHHFLKTPTDFRARKPSVIVATASILERNVMPGFSELQTLAEKTLDLKSLLQLLAKSRWDTQMRDWIRDQHAPKSAKDRLNQLIQKRDRLVNREHTLSLLRNVSLAPDMPSIAEIRYHLVQLVLQEVEAYARDTLHNDAKKALDVLSEQSRELAGFVRTDWADCVPRSALESLEDVHKADRLSDVEASLLNQITHDLLPETVWRNRVSQLPESVSLLRRLGEAQGHYLRSVGKSEGFYFLWWRDRTTAQERIEIILTTNENAARQVEQFRRRIEKYTLVEEHDYVPHLREILSRILGLSQHAQKLISDYEGDKENISRHYINLLATPRRSESQHIDELLQSWLKDDSAVHLTLLGEYGSGKTTVSRKFASDLADQFLNSQGETRAPIRIDLRFTGDTMGPEALIRSALSDYATDASDEFLYLAIEAGLVVIIFDGFDEMASRALEQQIVEQFRRLASLVRGPRAKMLVTCRSNYFITTTELLLATVAQREEQSELMKVVESSPGFLIAVLERLTDKQVNKYLAARLAEPERGEVQHLIEVIYDLPDLSKLPLLLDMIVNVRDSLHKTILGNLTIADLYLNFTQKWLGRIDADTLNTQEKIAISRCLARGLWTQGIESLDMRDLFQASLVLYGGHRNESDWIQKVVIETRHATFLARDGEQRLRFAHKSFLEFFLAYDIVMRLNEENHAPFPEDANRTSTPRYITQEVAEFLDGLLRRENNEVILQKRLDSLVQNADTRNQKAAALVAGYRLHSLHCNGLALTEKLAKVWGSGLSLQEVNLSHQDLPFIHLVNADLRGAHLQEANLNHANLSGALLASANLNGSLAENSRWTLADLTKAQIEQARWQNSILDEVHLDGARLSGSHLDRASMRHAMLNDAILESVRLIGADLTEASAQRANFCYATIVGTRLDGLNVNDADFSGAAFYDVDLRKTIGVPCATHESARAPRQPRGITLPQPPWRGGGGSPFKVSWPLIGATYAVSSWDHTVRLFDARSARLLREFEHPDSVRDFRVSDDGMWLVTACSDGRVRLFDTTKSTAVQAFEHTSAVRCCAFSRGARRLVTGCADGKIRLWDRESGRLIRECEHDGPVELCDFGGQSDLIAVVSNRGTVKIYKTELGELVITIESPARLRACVFSFDGVHLALGRIDGKAQLFNVETGTWEFEKDYNGSVWSCAFSRDNDLLLTSDDDGKVRMFQVSDGRQLLQLEHIGWVWSAVFSPDAQFILSSCDDGKVRIFDAVQGRLRQTVEHGRWVRAAAISSDSKRIAAACSDAKVRIFDAANGQLLHELEHGSWSNACAFSSDGSLIVTTCGDGIARLFETETGRLVHALPHGHRLRACAFSPVELRVITGSGDGYVRVFDAVNGQLLHRINHGDEIWTCAFAPDGKSFVAGSFGGQVKIYSVEDGRLLFEHRHPSWVRTTAFSPDGTRLATGCRDGKVRFFDTASGKSLKEITVGAGLEVWATAYSPDGKRLVTSGGDSRVRIYDIQSERQELSFTHPGWVWTCNFFPDGIYLMTGCDDGKLRIYWAAISEQESEAKPLLTIVAAFPIPHSISSTGYFALPREGVVHDCDVHCRNADYPLSLLNNHINRNDYVTATLRGEEVPKIEKVLESEFPEVIFPDNWPKPE